MTPTLCSLHTNKHAAVTARGEGEEPWAEGWEGGGAMGRALGGGRSHGQRVGRGWSHRERVLFGGGGTTGQCDEMETEGMRLVYIQTCKRGVFQNAEISAQHRGTLIGAGHKSLETIDEQSMVV